MAAADAGSADCLFAGMAIPRIGLPSLCCFDRRRLIFAVCLSRKYADNQLLMLASVIVVHDSSEFLASAASTLRGAGYGVTCHGSPLAAIDDVEAGTRIDALVTGLAFPAGSPHGISLARMLRVRRRGLPVVFVGSEARFQTEAASIGELLPSPVDPSELAAAVGRAIRKALGVRSRAFC